MLWSIIANKLVLPFMIWSWDRRHICWEYLPTSGTDHPTELNCSVNHRVSLEMFSSHISLLDRYICAAFIRLQISIITWIACLIQMKDTANWIYNWCIYIIQNDLVYTRTVSDRLAHVIIYIYYIPIRNPCDWSHLFMGCIHACIVIGITHGM